MSDALRASVQRYFEDLQQRTCAGLESLDAAGRFGEDRWSRPGGGGGLTKVLADGGLFEKAGVNTSAVWGEFDDQALKKIGGSERQFFATGISVVLHPKSPMVPTLHANLRYLERADKAWFGGGCDLTPYYPFEQDVRDFHAAWKTACDRHNADYYPKFKKWCDEYFYLPHRGEMRGVGGIFFDDLPGDAHKTFAFVRECGDSILAAYEPIARRRAGEPYGERERNFQLYRRGRYVEFNLVYDRGTIFGLATSGRAESILMSLPPLARWQYGWRPEPGSREDAAGAFFQPRDWIA